MKKSGTRARVIRDALYTALWNLQRGGGKLRHSLDCPKSMEGQAYRLKGGKVVEIDAWGLEINDEMRMNLGACRKDEEA